MNIFVQIINFIKLSRLKTALAIGCAICTLLVVPLQSANVLPFLPKVEIKTTMDGKIEASEKLTSETDSLLPLFDNMPRVPVFITTRPILENGNNVERGVAFTTCESKDFPVIFVKKTFYLKTNQKQLTNILKHELTHAWLCRQNQMSGHDKTFQEKFKQIGGFGN